MSASRAKPAARIAFCRPASRTMSWAVGGSGGRGGRLRTNLSSPRSIRKVKFEPPPSPIRVATTGPAPRPCASRNASTFSSTISGGLSAIAAMLRTMRRRLYLMRHAEVSYVGERDPEVVRLTERGLEQAAAAHRALDDVTFDLVVTSGLPRTLETAAVVVPEQPARAVARIRRVARRPPGRRSARGARRALRRLAPGATTRPRGSSAASRSARRSTACCRHSKSSWPASGRRRSPSFTAA